MKTGGYLYNYIPIEENPVYSVLIVFVNKLYNSQIYKKGFIHVIVDIRICIIIYTFILNLNSHTKQGSI